MSDDRKLKILLFGKMDGKNKRGRPHREWTDDIVERCGKNLQELSHLALDRSNWQKMVKQASMSTDTEPMTCDDDDDDDDDVFTKNRWAVVI